TTTLFLVAAVAPGSLLLRLLAGAAALGLTAALRRSPTPRRAAPPRRTALVRLILVFLALVAALTPHRVLCFFQKFVNDPEGLILLPARFVAVIQSGQSVGGGLGVLLDPVSELLGGKPFLRLVRVWFVALQLFECGGRQSGHRRRDATLRNESG